MPHSARAPAAAKHSCDNISILRSADYIHALSRVWSSPTSPHQQEAGIAFVSEAHLGHRMGVLVNGGSNDSG